LACDIGDFFDGQRRSSCLRTSGELVYLLGKQSVERDQHIEGQPLTS
jgi:hypothetical protein